MDRKELEELLDRFINGERELFPILKSQYEILLKETPDDIELIRVYGSLFQREGNAYLLQAEKIYETALFKTTNNSIRIDGPLMQVRNALGKNKESISLYKKRIVEHPDNPVEYSYLALSYLYADQPLEAKKVIDAIEKICVDVTEYSVVAEIAADVYARVGETEKALEYWDKAVKDQFTMSGWFSRAFMFKDLGRLQEAAAEWLKIIDLLERYHDTPQFTSWAKGELANIEAQLNTK